jgi:hypothetical protein
MMIHQREHCYKHDSFTWYTHHDFREYHVLQSFAG